MSYDTPSTDCLAGLALYYERFIMDSKTRTLVLSVAVSVVLWLLGGFVFNHTLGIICVFVSIALIGLAAGNMMNTPEMAHGGEKE